MTTLMLDQVGYRRALEALRNGVPNQDAVKALGCAQERAEAAFDEQLQTARTLVASGRQAPGLLVAGGFGSGKSHLLEYLQARALDAGFVCSRIVISKETPLHDQAKMFRAAMDSAVVPGVRGQAMEEIALRLRPSSSSYVEFDRWAKESGSGVSELFPATLLLHERLNNDPDLVAAVTAFWSGEPLPVQSVRQGLKQCDADKAFTIKAVPARQLAHERFLFASRLILGAGFKGWVLLIDEVELVGRYSLMQRAKSYAELARWMGRLEGSAYPGLTAVAAITDDFAISVIKQRGDENVIGQRLREKGGEEMALLAARAEAGMRLIERDAVDLLPPTEATLADTYEAVKKVHAGAYGWTPPDVEGGELTLRRAMRSYVRRWINEWDLLRLNPGAHLDTLEEDLHPTYEEDPALEVESSESD
jgi:P-loop Domain of unknown function (DUF2791)